MFTLKDTKQSLMGVILDSFRLVNKTWAVNILTILVFYILHVVIDYFFIHSNIFTYEHALQYFTYTQVPVTSTAVSASAVVHTSVALQIVGTILSVWLSLIFRAILARTCWNVATTGNAKIGNAFSIGLKYFYVYFAVMVIYTAVAVALYWIVYAFSLIGLEWLTAIVSIIAACIFYYVIIKLFLVEVMAVIDDCGFKAIARSWSIVSAGWWRTLGALVFTPTFYTIMLLFTGIGIFLAVAAPGAVGQMSHIQETLTGSHAPHWFSLLWRLDILLTFICIFFTVPSLTAGTQVVLVNDLKRRSGETS